jgi:23S rRNA-/tRNA-specific pseudouridylate synthase
VNAGEESFWQSLPLGRETVVLAHDQNGLAALSKPAGVLSHPNAPGEESRSLLQARYQPDGEFFQWDSGDGPQRLWLLNRLDSATSGVILVSAGESLATNVRAHFRQKQVHKVYNAVVFGRPPAPNQVWRDRLAVEKRGGQIRTATTGHIPAESHMKVLRSGLGKGQGRSLIKLEPLTGRSHQLRVQCAKRHLPIIGDQTYGDFARNREFAKLTGEKRLFLHSLETRFAYEHDGRLWQFSAAAPLPAEFTAVLQ